jgi:hypothetical protein
MHWRREFFKVDGSFIPVLIETPMHLKLNQNLSTDYYKRRQQLWRARIQLAVFTILLLTFLLSFHVVETWASNKMVHQSFALGETLSIMASVALFLAVYCLALARLVLHLVYFVESANVAKTSIIFIFVAVYGVFYWNDRNPLSILLLAMGKFSVTLIFFGFWTNILSQLRWLRLTSGQSKSILLDTHSFFVCGWVLVASWLILNLGFALSIVSRHPVLNLSGWEGMALIGVFFILFNAFAKNPSAHFNPSKRFPKEKGPSSLS